MKKKLEDILTTTPSKKKPACFFTCYDHRYKEMAEGFKNSLRKFHPDIPLYEFTEKDIGDSVNWYKQKPLLAKDLIREYEIVIGMDVDQIVMGSLDHILNPMQNYDVGTVLNINRVDPKSYGYITVCTIPPHRYYNCGLVVMRNEKFVDHWYDLCFSPLFQGFKYGEQDVLNVICHYGNYYVKCLDDFDIFRQEHTWNGLINKGEGLRMQVRDGEVILPIGEDNYPNREVKVKVYHFAGGGNEPRNYRLYFNEEMQKHIEWLISGENNETKA